MDKISYFGTDGEKGHHPHGINYYMTDKERDFFNNCDGDWFFDLARRHRTEEHKCYYWYEDTMTVYCLLYSVDDERHGSHTDLFVEGVHTIEEMEKIIESNSFLKRQFDVENRFKK